MRILRGKSLVGRLVRALHVLPVLALIAIGCGDSRPSPNVVLIVIDTLRADHLPFYDYPKDTAPFLSTLAVRAALFERAYSVTSWTAPGTASILTSLYPIQHGVVTGFKASQELQEDDPRLTLNRIPDEVMTIAEVFKAKGYRTFGIADNLNICEEMGFDQGFDRFVCFESSSYETADTVNAQLERWGPEIVESEPYFVYLHYNDPHVPRHRRAPWFEKHDDPIQYDISAYDSEINYLDERIAAMFQLFGWESGTLVVVTSDHGEEFTEHGMTMHGKTLYSEVVHVPLFIYHPDGGVTARRIPGAVSTIDILPTLRELARLPSDDQDEGTSLAGLMDGTGAGPRDRMLYGHLLRREGEYHRGELLMQYAIDDRWKYILTLPSVEEELFDIEADPGDMDDRAEESAEVAKSLRTRLLEFANDCRKYASETVETKVSRERLRALGYLQ